jgi:Ca-activated chloride channel family protein
MPPRTVFAHAIDHEPVAMLRGREGDVVPLRHVAARGRLEGLLFELTVEQRYENTSAKNLEAVFTFPLPLRAVLLGFDLELGDRKLSAHAVARQEASERYERAIDQGDTAALIEHDGNGLYTVSLGNLMAGESAAIRYRYAELLDAHDGYVRLNVPTVIAPRYGNPADAGLEGPTIPGVDLLGEYPFSLRLDLVGFTNLDAVRSPSHRISTSLEAGAIAVTLARDSFLDRDFVLELERAAVPSHVLVARDGDGFVALASPTLRLDQAEKRPLALKILLDCSGSMGGDSIAAAKRALLAILARLGPDDRVSLTRFGSTVEHITEGLETGDEASLKPLTALVRRIDANLGGTEMESALESVLDIPTPQDRTPDLVLITDGEIYDVAGVVGRAAQSRHRLFAIAIGAAPNETLARSLADQTGGACEFVGPTEDAEAAILRTFKRLRSTPRSLGTIQWPTTANWATPLPSAVFPGDTLHICAGFAAMPTGSTTLTVTDATGQGTQIVLPVAAQLTEGDLLPRLAAARRLASLAEDEARDLAVKYQLACAFTSFVVVAERTDGERAQDLPATVAVPHMLAAGWGSSSSVGTSLGAVAGMVACSIESPVAFRRSSRAVLESSHMDDGDYFDIPDFLRRQAGGAVAEFDPSDRTALLASLLAAHQRGEPLPTTIADLTSSHPVPTNVAVALHDVVVNTGKDESEVVKVFLALLAENSAAKGLDRAFRSALRGSILGSRAHRGLRAILMAALFQ